MPDSNIVLSETSGPHQKNIEFEESQDKEIQVCDSHVKVDWRTKIHATLHEVFLPQGYPDSVSEDYLEYQIWDTIQALCSSITGTLATQAVLRGVGVGDETATVLAATLTWLMKDGSGMFGRIMFAWWKGTELDCDCKKWRLFADILNDSAICLQLLAPCFPLLFTPILCMSSVMISLVGVAGGATRTALTTHQSKRNNFADVAAKDGSQETVVNLTALILSFIILPLITDNSVLVWSMFVIFTFLHLYTNYRAVTSVVMATLNRARLLLILHHFFTSGVVPSLRDINKEESVILGVRDGEKEYCGYKVELGRSFQQAFCCWNNQNLGSLKTFLAERNCNSFIVPDVHQRKLYAMLREDCTQSDIFKAYVESILCGLVLDHLLRREGSELQSKMTLALLQSEDFKSFRVDDEYSFRLKDILPKVQKLTTSFTEKFLCELNLQGWQTGYFLLAADEWRYRCGK